MACYIHSPLIILVPLPPSPSPTRLKTNITNYHTHAPFRLPPEFKWPYCNILLGSLHLVSLVPTHTLLLFTSLSSLSYFLLLPLCPSSSLLPPAYLRVSLPPPLQVKC